LNCKKTKRVFYYATPNFNLSTFAFFAFWIFVSGCRGESPASESPKFQIPTPGKVAKLDPIKLLQASEIIIPELTEESGISEINKILSGPEGEWIVVNHNPRNNVTDLLLFTEGGSFQNRIRGLYDGPGNFTGLEDFLLSNDTLELFDGVQNKRVLYNTKGRYIDENTFYPDLAQANKISDNLYAVYRGNAFRYAHHFQEPDNLVMVNTEGDISNKTGIKINPAFEDNDITSKAFWNTTKGKVYFLPPTGHEIYGYKDSNQKWSVEYTIASNNEEDRNAELKRIATLPPQNRSFDILNFLNASERWISNYRNFAITDDYVLLNYAQSGNGVFACFDKKTSTTRAITLSPNIFGNYYLFFPDPEHILFAVVNPYFLQSQLEGRPDYDTTFAPIFGQMTGEPNPLFITLPIDTFISILMETAI
jgi:hypothetical protein